MKRAYTKPDILFDSFSMSTSIAVCTTQSGQPTQSSCGLTFGNMTIFVTGISGCKTSFNFNNKTPVNGMVNSDNDAACYHNPTATFNIYNS